VALTSGVGAALQKHTRSAVPFLPLTDDREYFEFRPLRAIALTRSLRRNVLAGNRLLIFRDRHTARLNVLRAVNPLIN
jgi:hypothetical protein